MYTYIYTHTYIYIYIYIYMYIYIYIHYIYTSQAEDQEEDRAQPCIRDTEPWKATKSLFGHVSVGIPVCAYSLSKETHKEMYTLSKEAHTENMTTMFLSEYLFAHIVKKAP